MGSKKRGESTEISLETIVEPVSTHSVGLAARLTSLVDRYALARRCRGVSIMFSHERFTPQLDEEGISESSS